MYWAKETPTVLLGEIKPAENATYNFDKQIPVTLMNKPISSM